MEFDNRIYDFTVPGHVTQREWAIYVVKIFNDAEKKQFYYVGKVGDNRNGCNPIISRIGNHFSHNEIHSQIRNYLKKSNRNANEYYYQIFYATFGTYIENEHSDGRKKINELERTLNRILQSKIKDNSKFELLNPHSGKSTRKEENERRKALLTENDKIILDELVRRIFSKNLI